MCMLFISFCFTPGHVFKLYKSTTRVNISYHVYYTSSNRGFILFQKHTIINRIVLKYKFLSAGFVNLIWSTENKDYHYLNPLQYNQEVDYITQHTVDNKFHFQTNYMGITCTSLCFPVKLADRGEWFKLIITFRQ